MQTDLSKARCFRHAQREAAAQCLSCSRLFCRECVTEHDGRVICATCLEALAGGETARGAPAGAIVRRTLASLGGFVVIWILFYSCGQLLLRMPSSFHEGTLWTTVWERF